MVAAVVLAVIASIAGHPVQVACDADVNHSSLTAPIDFQVVAWAVVGGSVIHVLPRECLYSFAVPRMPEFAEMIEVFIHEAAHARGIASESCAELTVDIGVFDVLRRFYRVPFFSPLSLRVGAEVLAHTRTLLPDYQPEACWNSG